MEVLSDVKTISQNGSLEQFCILFNIHQELDIYTGLNLSPIHKHTHITYIKPD